MPGTRPPDATSGAMRPRRALTRCPRPTGSMEGNTSSLQPGVASASGCWVSKLLWETQSLPLLCLPNEPIARGGELIEAPAGGSGDPIHQPPEKWEKFILFLTWDRDWLKLFRHRTNTARQGSNIGFYQCRGTQLFEGDSIFLSCHCREGACPVPFVWFVFVEKLRTRFTSSPCRSGGKRNFSERSASLLTDTVGEARIW